MLQDKDDNDEIAKIVFNEFNNIGHVLDHDKHIALKECQSFGLRVVPLEDDQELQDIVLTVHHTFMHTLSSIPIVKAIENQNGVGIFLFKKS